MGPLFSSQEVIHRDQILRHDRLYEKRSFEFSSPAEEMCGGKCGGIKPSLRPKILINQLLNLRFDTSPATTASQGDENLRKYGFFTFRFDGGMEATAKLCRKKGPAKWQVRECWRGEQWHASSVQNLLARL